MTPVFAYIRVSTARQGTTGSSLQEQRSAISAYATRHGLEIREWFEERETAAKRGRPIFNRMLEGLARKCVSGVIIHKIDRSARNLKDWVDLVGLVERGVDVHFAHESLDLKSRGGRLTADIGAVIAADFSRNNSEETRKGIQGRLKQGLYPMPAPIGYIDQGRGLPKLPDPIMGSLLRRTFELYATGDYNLRQLGQEMYGLGLRNRKGGRVTRNGFSKLLNNEFYTGIIHVRRTDERYQGVHEPLITVGLFQQVRAVLRGRKVQTNVKHDYAYRKLITCAACGYRLIGERQKGHVYYRCHTRSCPPTCLRETSVDEQAVAELARLQLPPDDYQKIVYELEEMLGDRKKRVGQDRQELQLRLGQIDAKLGRLTDAFIDQMIDGPLYVDRKARLLRERVAMAEMLRQNGTPEDPFRARVARFLELLSGLMQSHKPASLAGRRDLLKSVTSNLRADQKKILIDWKSGFVPLVDNKKTPTGVAQRDTDRTWKETVDDIYQKIFDGGDV
jgi:DNA invertase Pin-like site-specific DNA recombinase